MVWIIYLGVLLCVISIAVAMLDVMAGIIVSLFTKAPEQEIITNAFDRQIENEII